MEAKIKKQLNLLEEQYNITVLLCVEAGSRAWGLHSEQSDYDVKFIYVNHIKWYLSIDLDTKRDVIDHSVVIDDTHLDMNGWDLRKALGLLRESNCGISEWLRSPSVYYADPLFVEGITNLSVKYHSKKSLVCGYRAKAMKHIKEYLQHDEVELKKYFFVMQPLIAIEWIAQNETEANLPPIDFETNLQAIEIDQEVKEKVLALIALKKAGELKKGRKLATLDKWIENKLGALDTLVKHLFTIGHPPAEFSIFTDFMYETTMRVHQDKGS